MASLEERTAEERGRRDAVTLAAASAVLLGLFIYFFGRASQNGGALSALIGARSGSLPLLLGWALATRTPVVFGRNTAAVAAVGVMDVTANALFALARPAGVLAIVSAAGAPYPVPTVPLGRLGPHQRIPAVQ